MDTSLPTTRLIVYGHNDCPQSRLLQSALTKQQIDHEWRDVLEGAPSYQGELRNLAHGNLSVPTAIFPDGTVMIEPWPHTVLRHLILDRPNFLQRLFSR
jgi:hypothetical protein